MRKKLKLRLMVATVVARNENEAMVGAGGVCVWRESGFSRREDVFIFDLVHKEILKFCTFNGIFRDNSAINCFCSTQKGLIPVNFDGSYYVSK
jgi:hypothetical protein